MQTVQYGDEVRVVRVDLRDFRDAVEWCGEMGAPVGVAMCQNTAEQDDIRTRVGTDAGDADPRLSGDRGGCGADATAGGREITKTFNAVWDSVEETVSGHL